MQIATVWKWTVQIGMDWCGSVLQVTAPTWLGTDGTRKTQVRDMAHKCGKQNMGRKVAMNATNNRRDMVWALGEIGLNLNLAVTERGAGVDPLFVIHEVTNYIFLK